VARSARQLGAEPASTSDRDRRAEILDTAADLFASSGFRTSLQELAEACGILPGSLYHHFESKEAIFIELVKRYQAEMDDIAAAALESLRNGEGGSHFQRIAALADAASRCGTRHRAALLQTFYEPPAGASDELVALAKRPPTSIDNALREILASAQAEGYLRKDIDLALFAERIRVSMLNGGIIVLNRTPGAGDMPTIKCRMLLDGLAVERPTDAALDRSAAFAAAERVIAGWGVEAEPDPGDRAALLRAAARAEFGRRGYEATTMRDIAAAAGVSVGLVYRLVGSKDELLASIMNSYVEHSSASMDAIMAAEATAVEKLDALLWVDINLLNRFSDEFNIQRAWLRESPPTQSTNLGSFRQRERQVKALLSDGERGGQFRNPGGTVKIRTACMLELTWTPLELIQRIGARGALSLARETLIRGAAERQ
jgi:AcrR family transcriptional regulator